MGPWTTDTTATLGRSTTMIIFGVSSGLELLKEAVDEYSIATELSEERSVQGEEQVVAPVGGKKKGKKGKNT
ncbi:hypothetical protein M8C21_003234 [Ambrosia artemisiifolia]|uniref:Uncharacterized protein n=1 Tax=Ambrosia artemisiifolia TaxID=4212 RepID=A0AAD5GKX0_AMBAR|nr:hypothetical protein M8C21_003234 [Ambrosia artemisiifolia]